MRWVGSGTVTELLTVNDDLKAYCQLTGTGTTYDTMLTAFVKTAGDYLEKKVGYPLRYPNVTVFFETKNSCEIRLPKNVNAITTYYYKDGDEYLEQTFTDIIRNDFQLYSELLSSEIKKNTLYKIVCTANLNTSETIKSIARAIVAEMFEQRENKQLNTTGGVTNWDSWVDIYLAGEIAHNIS